MADAIRAAIRDGRWRPDEVVPSTRALAHDLGIARGTVTRVYADLVAEGYLRSSQGAPTRVATAGAAPASAPQAVREPLRRRWTLHEGKPDPSMFPRDQWLAATRRVLHRSGNSIFDYGDPRGESALRTVLSAYLGRSRGVLADPARMVICAGYSHGITAVARALLDLGVGELAFEEPSYRRFRDLAASAGQRVVGVPVDHHGLSVESLSSPAVVVTPAHQAPLGVTMAPARRTALLRSAALVVEDDYDGEFRFDRHQVGALQALAPERVIYAGTVSKTLSPALRLGWLVLPRDLVDPVASALDASGAGPPVLDQLALAELIGSGAYDRHVRRCRTEYRARRDRLVTALPNHLTPQGISAGLHLVVPLSGAAEAAVPAAARRHSLAITTLAGQWITDGPHPSGLVVGYGASPGHSFTGALDALLRTLADLPA